MTDKSLCDSCTNIGCEFQSGIVRTKCAFYMPPQLEPDNCGNYVVQDSTTKNDIRDNRVKNELNRVKDELEPTTKNDLGDDCVRRKAVLNTLERMDKVLDEDRTVDSYKELLKECYKVLPSVAPQESILDKIRAEIEQNAYSIVHGVNNHEKGMTLYGVLQIIDKYKAESEGEDYESRLKADMVAMLKEIQLEIEENSYSENVYGDEYGINKVISTDDIYQIIQQKIDKCKAESEKT